MCSIIQPIFFFLFQILRLIASKRTCQNLGNIKKLVITKSRGRVILEMSVTFVDHMNSTPRRNDRLAKAAMHLTCIQEVPGSSLSQGTDSPD
jgi:hypothetical protein